MCCDAALKESDQLVLPHRELVLRETCGDVLSCDFRILEVDDELLVIEDAASRLEEDVQNLLQLSIEQLYVLSVFNSKLGMDFLFLLLLLANDIIKNELEKGRMV